MNRSKCPECGFVGWADAEACKRCGAAMVAAPGAMSAPPAQSFAPAYPSYNASPGYNAYPSYNVSPNAQLKTGLATASLVIGILNFLFFGIFVIPTIVGIVISVVALKRIKRNPHEYGGQGLAIGGLVTNIVCVVCLIPVLMIAAIAVPNLMASIRAANEGAALYSLRRICEAEATYRSKMGDGPYGTLSDLKTADLISPELASGTKSGYRFTVELTSNRDGFAVRAVPITYGRTGVRSFFVDESGVLRAEDSHGLESSKYARPLNSNRDYYPDSRPPVRRTSSYSDDE
jgi:type IV pilus assembly protein PilA